MYAIAPCPVPSQKDNAFVRGKSPQFTSRLLDGAVEGVSELPRIGSCALEES